MNVRYDMIACFVVRETADKRSHEFLQLRRAVDDYLSGTWQTVYGCCLDPHEIAWKAALRELQEETGLVPREFYRLATARSFYIAVNDTLWHVPPFCAIVSGCAEVVLNAEHDAARWIARADAPDSFMWATDRESIAEICRDILDDGQSKPHLWIDIESKP